MQIDPEHRVRFTNRVYAQYLDFRHEDVLGRHLRDLMGEAAYVRVLSHLSDAFTGQRVEFEVELQHRADAGRHSVYATYSPQHNPDGKVWAPVCVAGDITECKEAKHERFRYQREFVTLVRNVPDTITRLDRELRCMYANRAVAEAFGMMPAVIVGKTLVASPLATEVAHPPEDVARHAFAVGVEQALTLYLDMLDGRPRVTYYDACVIPKADRSGVMELALFIIYDMTERTEAEHECDVPLLRKQVARAQIEAVARVCDQFPAVVLYELRSPLSGIQNQVYVLENQVADSAPLMQCVLAGIKTGVEQQVRPIEDLLDATRVVSGKLQLTCGPFVLRVTLEHTLSSVHAPAVECHIVLYTAIDLDDHKVDGDVDRVEQVMRNLLTNAIKFMQEGGDVWLSVDLLGEVACIIVRDNGHRIASTSLLYLSDSFRQADGAHTRRTGGLGLGFALVERLTGLHGGCVYVRSEGDQHGAASTICLPLYTDADLIAPLAKDPEHDGPLPLLAGLRMLLVDDQQDAHDALVTLLTQVGAEVGSVGSGHETMALFDLWGAWSEAGLLQAVVCDTTLPDEDGYAILRRIRTWEHEHLPTDAISMVVIALTAFTQSHDRVQVLAAGFQEHLIKPISPYDLVRTLRMPAISAASVS